MRELEESASILGCAAVVTFGFKDSGWRTTPPADAFSRLAAADAAVPLTALLVREAADALTIYDPAVDTVIRTTSRSTSWAGMPQRPPGPGSCWKRRWTGASSVQ